MTKVTNDSIDGIVNSPPYAVALDYVKNDYPQLVLLELTNSIEELDNKMIGSPRMSHSGIRGQVDSLSESANKIVNYLINNGKWQAGLRSYKFFVDMYEALSEMHRVMKKGGKAQALSWGLACISFPHLLLAYIILVIV